MSHARVAGTAKCWVIVVGLSYGHPALTFARCFWDPGDLGRAIEFWKCRRGTFASLTYAPLEDLPGTDPAMTSAIDEVTERDNHLNPSFGLHLLVMGPGLRKSNRSDRAFL